MANTLVMYFSLHRLCTTVCARFLAPHFFFSFFKEKMQSIAAV